MVRDDIWTNSSVEALRRSGSPVMPRLPFGCRSDAGQARGFSYRFSKKVLGNVPSLQHDDGASASRRPDRENCLHGRSYGERGRPSCSDRSASVPGDARSSKRKKVAGRRPISLTPNSIKRVIRHLRNKMSRLSAAAGHSQNAPRRKIKLIGSASQGT